MVGCEFDARADIGKAIEHFFLLIFPDEDGHPCGAEVLVGVAEPEEGLAADGKGQVKFREKSVEPGSGGEDELFGFVGGHGGGHGDVRRVGCRTGDGFIGGARGDAEDGFIGGAGGDAEDGFVGGVGVDAEDGFVGMDGGAMAGGLVEEGADTFFGIEDAGFFFEHADGTGSRFEGGKAAADGARIEPFEGDVVGFGAEAGALNNGGVGGTEEEAAGALEEGFAGSFFEFGPEGIGGFYQRNIEGAFVVGLTDNAAFAVGGTFLMRGLKAIDP